MSTEVPLEPVDGVEITILVDNSVEILAPSTGLVSRPDLPWDWADRKPLIAEHGYSLSLTARSADRTLSLLYDCGFGPETAARNLEVLGMEDIHYQAIVLSHGHIDHHGGIEQLLRRAEQQHVSIVLHPDAWLERRLVLASGSEVHLPGPSRQELERGGRQVVEARCPSLLLENMVLVSGQVERITDFEHGLPLQQAHLDGGWVPDPLVCDDQAVVCNLQGKGLVALSACSHAGVVNVPNHARRLTGVERVYALVGGLHLEGEMSEATVSRTIEALVALGPEVLVPGHCTGWRATHELARRMPGAYIQGGVGTRLRLTGERP
jgi:7,8-dihydropterin-6-yl-methyl-4-(beta-D-ribofuranosyl)aminobenzene 5'-phosphate synthase